MEKEHGGEMKIRALVTPSAYLQALKPKLSMLGALIVYKYALEFAYSTTLAPHYGYLGFSGAFSVINSVIGSIILVFLGVFLPSRVRRPSDLVSVGFFSLIFVPLAVLATFRGATTPYLLIIGGAAFVFQSCWFVLPPIDLRRESLTGIHPIYWAAPIVVITLLWLWLLFGLPNPFQGWGAYSQRALYKDIAPQLLRYLIPWAVLIGIPLMVVEGLIRRSFLVLLGAISASSYIYLVTGFKKALIVPGIIGAAYFVLNWKESVSKVLLSVSGAVLLTVALYGLSDEPFSILVRRSIMVPGLITSLYFDFFAAGADHLYYSQSHISLLWGGYESGASLSHAIGLQYFGSSDINAVTGWIGSSYANLGAVGPFIYAVVLSTILRLFDGFRSRKRQSRAMALCLGPLLSLVNSSLHTAFLTQGLLISLVGLFLMSAPWGQKK